MRETCKVKPLEKILRLTTGIVYKLVEESHVPQIFPNECINTMAVKQCTEIINFAFTEPLISPSQEGI